MHQKAYLHNVVTWADSCTSHVFSHAHHDGRTDGRVRAEVWAPPETRYVNRELSRHGCGCRARCSMQLPRCDTIGLRPEGRRFPRPDARSSGYPKLAAGATYQGSGFVVADELGAAPSPEWLSDEFERAVKCAGVKRVTLHACRHSACTLMEQAGVPISVVSQWAGHATPEFTYRVYVHASDDDLAAGRDALSRVYAG
jgi:Phage integrase family